MTSRHLLFLAACAGLLQPARLEASGLEQAKAQQVAEQFAAAMQAKAANPQDSYQVDKVVVADLNGDSQPEIVVQWVLLGPSYWDYGLTVLAGKGQRFAPAGHVQEALGMVEAVSVSNGVIRVSSKFAGPKDPRCCPTVARTLRYRWTPGRLVPVK